MAECPSCRAPLAGDENFCLQCGTRLVPEPEPEQSWTMPIAIVAAIAVFAVAGVVFALEQVESDAEREATKPAIVVERPEPPGTEGGRPTEVAAWPAGATGYTVALTRVPDEAAARTRAAAAAASGVPVGVLDTSAYPTLEPGAWLLFAGRYDTRDEAIAEANRYAAAGFPDAAVVFVDDQPAAGEETPAPGG